MFFPQASSAPASRRCFYLAASAVFAFAVAVAPGARAAKPDAAPGHAAPPALAVDGTPVTEGKRPPLVSYSDVLEPVQKTVVSVASSRYVRQRLPFPWLAPGGGREFKQEGIGSGVIVTPDGYILTNHHVVEGADELIVRLADEREFKAEVVGSDPKTDVAVIKVDAAGLPAVTLADSDRIRVGDIVFAIGNPLGVGQTVTMGIVSATGRRVGILDEVAGYEDFIQTDAAINQGNSGGALLDAKGRLVGINSAILSPTRGNIGIGFAIPVNLARNIMNSLVTSGKVSRGFLGVSVDSLGGELAETLGLPRDTRGVIITDLSPGGPAEQAGLQRYDVITAINGQPVTTFQELRLQVARQQPDSEIAISLLRDGKEQRVTARLGGQGEALGYNELLPGVRVNRLTGELRRSLNIDPRLDGLVIASVDDDSPYAERLAPNMVIVEINRVPAGSIETARRSIIAGRNLFTVYLNGAFRPLVIVVK
ncbi:trypsin-like peptidase domain-containing protein [Termitidicoccus mucosus]|uniref:Protease Do n=1 Tax=Termitidicoccus mucosus TaxID=1184151 RepID=A0A178IFA3_9BACT|nr:protease Do [Opitutaceae bacterium TSB47]